MGALDNPKTGGRLLLLAADFLTVLLLTAGTALAFLSGYRVDVDLGAVIACCVAASAASAALLAWRRGPFCTACPGPGGPLLRQR